mmetsp:Transcript_24495/g.68673  ORF Transcript_24495/g.68673 Transcript_24495/m.68673 type:complete len:210 (+) Transcript_24495:91-720(+)
MKKSVEFVALVLAVLVAVAQGQAVDLVEQGTAAEERGIVPVADLSLDWCLFPTNCVQENIVWGDQINYTLTATMEAGGLGTVQAVLFFFPDPKSRLVPSIEVSSPQAYEVVTGNNDNDIAVLVNLGSVGQESVTVTVKFRVRIVTLGSVGVNTLFLNEGGVNYNRPLVQVETTTFFPDAVPMISYTAPAAALSATPLLALLALVLAQLA